MSFSWHRTPMFQTLAHDPLVGLKVNIIGQDWHFKNEIEERKKMTTSTQSTASTAQNNMGCKTERTQENPVCPAQ